MSLSFPSQSSRAQSFWPAKMPDGICWTSPHKHLWCLRGGSRPNAVIVEVTSSRHTNIFTNRPQNTSRLQSFGAPTCTSVDSTDYPFIVTFTNPPEVSFQMFLLMTLSNHGKFANTNQFDLQKHDLFFCGTDKFCFQIHFICYFQTRISSWLSMDSWHE